MDLFLGSVPPRKEVIGAACDRYGGKHGVISFAGSFF